MEFALGAPVLMAFGGYGIEVSNLAITNMRVSQYALQLADNASRIGVNTGLATYQLREGDINDALQGLRLFSANSKLTTYGRVTVSSLENVQQSYDDDNVQRIHWQRCIGMKSGTGFDSSYGTTSVSAGTDGTSGTAGTATPAGMGDEGQKVSAPENTGVIYVEINYQYQPLFGTLFVNPTKLHYVASVIVRDKRDFSQIYNPTPTATPSTCDKHNA
jgi:Flp pilus assembly protein TadG